MHSNLEELAAKDENPHTNNTKQTRFECVVFLVSVLKKKNTKEHFSLSTD